jgi:hypothetical protein
MIHKIHMLPIAELHCDAKQNQVQHTNSGQNAVSSHH